MNLMNIFFLLLLSVCTNLHAQQVSWVFTSGGAQTQSGTVCEIFADGSILNGGFFQGQTNFYPGDNTPRISRGGRDIFVQKVDTNGITQWVVTFGGKGEERLTDMAIDGDGNILLAGSFTDTCDFDPGSGTAIGISNGQTDMFLVKLNANGNYLWSRRFGGVSEDEINGLAVDSGGNIFIGGYFKATVDFSTNTTPNFQHSVNAFSGFVMMLDNLGERQWFRKFGNGTNDLTVKNLEFINSKLWVSGVHSEDSINFGSALVPVWVYSSEPQQTFILQSDLLGNTIRVDTFRSTVTILDLQSDNQNNILITGYFRGTADFDPGAAIYQVTVNGLKNDAYLLKLDSNTNFLWTKIFKSDMLASTYGEKVRTFETGDILFMVLFEGDVDFDPSSGIVTKSTNGNYDVAIVRLNESGQFNWVHTFGGTGYDYGNGLSVEEDKFYVTGSFRSTVDFNPGGPPYLLTANGSDAYLIKFGNYSTLSTPAYEILPTKIYPNPTSGILQLDGEFEHAQLLNLQGQLVYQQANLNKENTLDLSLLNEGIYLLTLIKQGRVSHHKVVIQR